MDIFNHLYNKSIVNLLSTTRYLDQLKLKYIIKILLQEALKQVIELKELKAIPYFYNCSNDFHY